MFEAGFFGTLECMFYDAVAAIDEVSTRNDRAELAAQGLLNPISQQDKAEISSKITDKANSETTVESNIKKNNKVIKNMKQLLGIMKKQVIGEFSEEDAKKIQKFASRWKKDIHNLSKSVDKLDFTEFNKMRKDDWPCDLHRENSERESLMKADCLEIENMRKLLNIMKRHLCGNLTPQDILNLEENMQKWDKDIKKLSKLLAN